MYCNGVIPKGTQYLRQCNVMDGYGPQYFICHTLCYEVADRLGMFKDDLYGDGVGPNEFEASIDDYIRENHPGKHFSYAEEWRGLTLEETVFKIYEETNKKE